MKPKQLLTASVAALCAFVFLRGNAHAVLSLYTVTDLGTLNSNYTWQGINFSGQVAGQSGSSAVRWTGTTLEVLGNLGGSISYGVGINGSGQVAGISTDPNGVAHAVRWTGTTPIALDTLGGTNSTGFGINDSGQVAGTSDLSGNSFYHAVRWTGTVAEDLGTLGGFASNGRGINNSGHVVGQAQRSDKSWHATVWTGTTPIDLGTLPGVAYAIDDWGIAISDSGGQVAGYAQTAGNRTHATRWTGTTAQDLGTLGGDHSFGYGVNDFGDVIGMSDASTGSGSRRAFFYTDGVMFDLNQLLVPNSGVADLLITQGSNCINNLGQIMALGTVDGQQHVLRLDPIPAPEPASTVLLVGGAALLGLRRRR